MIFNPQETRLTINLILTKAWMILTPQKTRSTINPILAKASTFYVVF